MRTVLLVAFHFPPIAGSSGVQRTLRFAQHLPKFGWRPVVLTAQPRAYERTALGDGNELPANLVVHRAFALDTSRHLSVFGRYPHRLAIPDRWCTWKLWAVPAAIKIIKQEHVDALWSTFPIATAHAIGLEVAKRTGLPWVAEFRDPMWQGDYPPDPVQNRVWRTMELAVAKQAARVVVVTPGAKDVYTARFGPDASKLELIENGYDEETFQRAASRVANETGTDRPFSLVHSGLVYPSERDPSQLFEALAALASQGILNAQNFRLVLRASGNENSYRERLARMKIDHFVALAPAVDYLSALQEMLSADGLLILQASNCNEQIPAKLYEYLRAGRPILALTDPRGDTARTLNATGGGMVARLDSAEDIERALPMFIDAAQQNTWQRPSSNVIASYSREALAGRLARLLDGVVGAAS